MNPKTLNPKPPKTGILAVPAVGKGPSKKKKTAETPEAKPGATASPAKEDEHAARPLQGRHGIYGA